MNEAREWLARAGKRYLALQSLTAKVEIQSTEAARRGFGTLAFRAPNRFMLMTGTAGGTQRQISDGTHYFQAHSADPPQYDRLPMPAERHGRAALAQYRPFGLLTPFLAGTDPWRSASGTTAEIVEMIESAEAGNSCVAVRVVDGIEETVYHIGRDDHLIHRTDHTRILIRDPDRRDAARRVPTGNAAGHVPTGPAPGPVPTGKSTVTHLYSAIEPDADVSGKLFAFVPPPGSGESSRAARYLRSNFGEGMEVPPFSGIDTAGNAWCSTDYRGAPLLIDFWSSTCAPCREELRHLREIRDRHPDLAIVGIAIDSDRAPLDAYLAENPVPWPILFDGRLLKGDIARLFQPRGVPTIILLDRNGKIVSVGSRGLVLEDEVEKAILEG